jgi:hypothetical protein
MKAILRTVWAITTVLFVSAIALAAEGLPEKYNLDNELTPVTEISKYNMMGWETVDNQSFVLQTTPSDYYLIVLSSPSDKLVYSENIAITTNNDTVKPGYNNVLVTGQGFEEKHIINKIYKFKDAEQVKTIKEKLTGK